MRIHRERRGLIDGICVDCKKFYECNVRENAEARGNTVTECNCLELEQELSIPSDTIG